MANHGGERPLPWVGVETDNLTGLTELNEDSLLEAVKARYEDEFIYTDVGDILVAVNPFRRLPIYDKRWSAAYSRPDVSALAPHIYRVAARAFNSMVNGKKDQVCVISGESGAGKTESAKFIIHQVMDMSRCAGLGQKLQAKILQLNPLLEAFGNASTALNNNSSRFGKYIQLVFQPNGRVVGAGLEQYLLEKSRVCVQGKNERNFHIFYYLYAGLGPHMLKDLQLKSPTEHRYLSSYRDVLTDCNSEENKASFDLLIDSMHSIGFDKDEIQQILTILAAIILIGDIEFEGADGDNDNAEVSNPGMVESVAQLLHLEGPQELSFALTTLRTTTRGETVDKRYTCTKAADVRDAVAKELYAKMFQWIVLRLNAYLQPRPSPDHLNIGILDIFGFENFDHNSFEQFCINLANEQLQQYFNHQIFAMEKVEYAREGLDGLEITYKDNKPVLDLFLTRPIGLLSLLDEQCRGLNGTDKAFLQRCRESFGKHSSYKPHRGNALVFTIKHYAGDVEYEAEEFIEKNKDLLPDPVVTALRFSDMRLVWALFSSHPSSSNNQLKKSIMRKNQRSVMRAMSRRRRSSMRGKVRPGARKLLTISAHFRLSLELLMERVFAASPHFVRCIKPNMDKQPNKFQNDMVLKQLRYTGMLEAVRVRREGFAYRPFFSDFFNCYRALAYYFTDRRVKASEHTCQVILDKAGITGWRLGRSRVFLRYFHEEKLQLLLKEMEDKTILIQKIYRGYCARKRVRPLKEAQRNQNAVLSHFLTSLNKHGQECFPKLLDLNKIDIKLAVKRFGNKRKERETVEAQNENLSDHEKRKDRAKKAGILVAVLGPALGEGVPLRRRKQSEEAQEEQEESDVSAVCVSPSSWHEPEESLLQLADPSHIGATAIGSHHQEEPTRDNVHTPAQTVSVNEGSQSWSEESKLTDHMNSIHQLQERRTVSAILADLANLPAKNPEQHSPASSSSPSWKRPVGGVMLLHTNQPPPLLPKPRKPPTPKHRPAVPLPHQSESEPHHQRIHHQDSYKTLPLPKRSVPHEPTTDPAATSSATLQRLPLKNQSSERESSLDFNPEVSSLDFNPQGSSLDFNSQGSSLDFYPQRGSNTALSPLKQGRKISGGISNSTPDLLSEEVFSSPASRGRLVRSKKVAGSSDNMLEEMYGDSYTPKGTSSSKKGPRFSGSSDIISPSHSSDTSTLKKRLFNRPKDDKRNSWKFKFGWRRSKKHAGSSEGSTSSNSDVPVSPTVVDVDLLGFYPSLSRDGAVDMVLGQPRGTYVIYKENSRIYSDQPRWHPAYRLVVSEGRNVNVFPITSFGDSDSGLRFHLEKPESDDGIRFSGLKSLVEHYKRAELSEGFFLLQPRLVAGVSVAHVHTPTSGKLAKKPNGFNRGRLAARRKS